MHHCTEVAGRPQWTLTVGQSLTTGFVELKNYLSRCRYAERWTVVLQGLKIASRLFFLRPAMSVDVVHYLIAIFFVSVWVGVTLLLRSTYLEDSSSAHEWDGQL